VATVLIASPRHTPDDLAAWEIVERTARAHASLSLYRRHVDRARAAVAEFVARTRCYAGVSWGKDSVVIAHMVSGLAAEVPVVWIRVEPICNPDCSLVRDAFFQTYPSSNYHEIVSQCIRDEDGWHATGTLERGFAEAAQRFGAAHVSGVRADESGQRKARMRAYGESSASTCAPIGWWSGLDVFAYLVEHDLPIHPAYACSLGGQLDATRIRVASLGGRRGDGHGRAEWERRYYAVELRRLR